MTRYALGKYSIENFEIPVPAPDEQSAIATFLDRETAKIDALATEYERLIDLLKEKRQAVISHAVTKGLDPKVPMKDSGVEWLGEVPAHWEVRRLILTDIIIEGQEAHNAIANQLLKDKRVFEAMQGMLARMVYQAFVAGKPTL